ncbi:MAG: DUF362 domain-containing protein [Deltaproteobacteria bacterium]|nr:DUF362 domain-containing protein [Deltaproteobacteria bacterium]
MHDTIIGQTVRTHDRRMFLKSLGLCSLGMLSAGCRTGTVDQTRQPPPKSDRSELVSVAAVDKGEPEDRIHEAVRRAAESATDFSWLSKGDTVFIKLASNSANVYPATTSPDSVLAMVKVLFGKGAGHVLVGDMPGVQSVRQTRDSRRGSSRDILKKNGLHIAALDAGAEVHYFDESGYDAYFGDETEHEGHWKGALYLPRILQQADHVVLLPRVSRHALAGTTLGLKAAVGWLRDDSRLELHRDAESFYEKAAEINDVAVLRRKLRLTLSLATKVQTTYGPDKGYVTEPDPGLVIASESLLAHDMVSLRWLLWNREHMTPQGRKSWFRDPYLSYPGVWNRIFVLSIWGPGAFLESETYTAEPITSVGSDPVLSRAAVIWGGFPRLELEVAQGNIPPKILNYLSQTAAL